MDSKKLLKLNGFINNSYECFSFAEFLKLSILKLHELVMYDSGMFFCAISKDCSYFKPYIGGNIEDYYKKRNFTERMEYLDRSEAGNAGNEAYVYKSSDYTHGTVQISNEPRSWFLDSQSDFYIVCLRIVYKGRFMGEIYLHRGKDKPDFDDEDLFTLRLMQPHVATVFNIIHTITAVKYLEESSLQTANTGICIFDGDLSLTGGNVAGVEMLKAMTVFGSSVLYHIKELCSETSFSAPVYGNKASLGTHLLKTPIGNMKIDIITYSEQNVNHKIQHIILMRYENDVQTAAEYRFKFTKREADIIDGLVQGKNNIQLADALNISENTIKTHIKSIYKKTGASNRTELTYVLMLNK